MDQLEDNLDGSGPIIEKRLHLRGLWDRDLEPSPAGVHQNWRLGIDAHRPELAGRFHKIPLIAIHQPYAVTFRQGGNPG